jgi:hypothetical protein
MLTLVETVMSRSPSGNVLLRDGDGVLGTHRVIEWLHTPCPARTIRRTNFGYACAWVPIRENVACTPFPASRSSTLGVQVGCGPSSMVRATVFVRAIAGVGAGRVAGAVPAWAAGAPATGMPAVSPIRVAAQPSTVRRDGCRR